MPNTIVLAAECFGAQVRGTIENQNQIKHICNGNNNKEILDRFVSKHILFVLVFIYWISIPVNCRQYFFLLCTQELKTQIFCSDRTSNCVPGLVSVNMRLETIEHFIRKCAIVSSSHCQPIEACKWFVIAFTNKIGLFRIHRNTITLYMKLLLLVTLCCGRFFMIMDKIKKESVHCFRNLLDTNIRH